MKTININSHGWFLIRKTILIIFYTLGGIITAYAQPPEIFTTGVTSYAGLQSIEVTSQINCTVSINSFNPGAQSVDYTVSTPIEPGYAGYTILATDIDGNFTSKTLALGTHGENGNWLHPNGYHGLPGMMGCNGRNGGNGEGFGGN